MCSASELVGGIVECVLQWSARSKLVGGVADLGGWEMGRELKENVFIAIYCCSAQISFHPLVRQLPCSSPRPFTHSFTLSLPLPLMAEEGEWGGRWCETRLCSMASTFSAAPCVDFRLNTGQHRLAGWKGRPPGHKGQSLITP